MESATILALISRLFFLLILLVSSPISTEADSSLAGSTNVTVMGTVFCDACSSINTFSKNSFFLQGAKVRITCSFKVNSSTGEEISVSVERKTDKLGIYRLEIPAVEGFECREGREMGSFCRTTLLGSPSQLCNVPGLRTSTEHLAMRAGGERTKLCFYNLNALNYRPGSKDTTLCGSEVETKTSPSSSSHRSSLFFWPPFCPPWPWPCPFPRSPPWPFAPIPFLTPPPPPTFPWPFPPLPFFTPPPPAAALPWPFPHLLPTPPSLPSFPPVSIFPPPPPPPSLPFPPLPFLPPTVPNPVVPAPPPPPAFSWRDPRTWFPGHPPSNRTKP